MENTEILAHIELNEDDGWLIRVIDTSDKEGYICDNVNEFSFAITKLGEKHNQAINVKWSKDPDVTPRHFYEVESGIKEMEKSLNEMAQS
ncbi:hypothetical protein [Arcobacter sp. FWKO B]|uniref:hypothetical protein n=1 Tax=Arcobacter sp. FWKO B TaxID=2593672 RepID=UPI0018A39E0D|nr:hypothetical protein [Arcobacter sp. FWKO B]QOG11909.1 hypothetical protein FWKOB_03965 [Arcobacter sp. FWKO B]